MKENLQKIIIHKKQKKNNLSVENNILKVHPNISIILMILTTKLEMDNVQIYLDFKHILFSD